MLLSSSLPLSSAFLCLSIKLDANTCKNRGIIMLFMLVSVVVIVLVCSIVLWCCWVFFLIILFVSFNCNLPTNGYKTHFASFKSLAVFSTNSSMCVTLFALYKKKKNTIIWMTITQLFPFSFTHFLVLQRQVYSQGFFFVFFFYQTSLT